MSIGILYERSETDELGIKLTATELGIKLVYIPFRKVTVRLNPGGYSVRSKGKNFSNIIKDVRVILNRAQSKNRRLLAANILEKFGKHIINPSTIEYLCYSKLRTLLHFWKEGIRIPQTVFVPCDSHETKDNREKLHNEEEIADLLQREFENESVVMKPDAGTHGKKVKLARNRDDLLRILGETEPSIINPLGILAQKLIQKWFYDLRIIVAKEKGKVPYCYPTALARAGLKDFRTNTFLGNMVFGVDLPSYIKGVAVRCGEALGKKHEAWLLALDAMIDVGDNKFVDDEQIKSLFSELEQSFDAVKNVKSDQIKKRTFSIWNRTLEQTFQRYKSQDAYLKIKETIEESVKQNEHNVLFHEANACPEFWEQTRLVAGINLAVPLLKCAQSLLDSNCEGV
jgi:glutathione synthase/RimK-type ligase-like ATP-grasp enzyme